jgi:hypothetical protein
VKESRKCTTRKAFRIQKESVTLRKYFVYLTTEKRKGFIIQAFFVVDYVKRIHRIKRDVL